MSMSSVRLMAEVSFSREHLPIVYLSSPILLEISSNLCSSSTPLFDTTDPTASSTVPLLSLFSLTISCFSFRISSLNASILLERNYSLTMALTLTILALLAKWRVDRDYWKQRLDWERVAMMKVFELPPRLSFKRQVSLESR